jgi:hypothetical protein
MGPQILKRFYRCTIENILTGCITAWYANSTALDRLRNRGLCVQPSTLPGPSSLPSRTSLSGGVFFKRPEKSWKTPTTQSHRLFSLLQHGKRYQWASDTNGLLNSFHPQAIRLINSSQNSYTDRVYLISLLTFYFSLYAHSQGPTHSHTLSLQHIHTHTCTQTLAHSIISSLTHNMLPSHLTPILYISTSFTKVSLHIVHMVLELTFYIYAYLSTLLCISYFLFLFLKFFF